MRTVVLHIAVVAATAFSLARSAVADDAQAPWIIEPTPEAPDAAKLAAPQVEQAQQLAKKKQYREAVDVLEDVARKFPAAVNDCNLSLAYLRAGALTRAQLLWDVAGLRNAPRPGWCTGGLSTQLSTALHAAGYVPLTIDVQPADAVISTGGVEVRELRTLWLPTGPAVVAARAPGHSDGSVQVTVVAPSTRVAIALTTPTTDTTAGARTTTGATTSAALPSLDLDAGARPHQVKRVGIVSPAHAARWPLYVGLGVAGAAILTGVLFDNAAIGARADANKLYTTNPAFTDDKNAFARDKDLAFVGYGVAVAALGFSAYWWLAHRDHTEPAGAIGHLGVTASHDRATLTLRWSWP